MAQDDDGMAEAMYDKAADIAGKHLDAALEEGGDLEDLVAVMMIEASVNAAVDATSRDDVVRLLKDLIEQIEAEEAEDD